MLERMDTFIYDLHSGRLDDLEFGIKALTRAPLETEKTVVVITSILSWGETEYKLVEDIPEPELDEDGNLVVKKIENDDIIEEKPEEEEKKDDETLPNEEKGKTEEDEKVNTEGEKQKKTTEKNETNPNKTIPNETQGDGMENKEVMQEINEEELKRQKELEELAKMPKIKVII
jgi:hypothetical protein